MKHSKKQLRRVLEPLEEEYGLIILDCPPNITLKSENVFRAADNVLVPFIPTSLSLVGYNKLLDFFRKGEMDDSHLFAFFSMVEGRKKMHKELIEKMSREDSHFINVQIPYAADVEKMGQYRAPLIAKKPHSKAALAFEKLWRTTKSRLLNNAA